MLSLTSSTRNHQGFLNKKVIPWLILIGLLITLYIGVSQTQKIQRWWSEATGKPAHLVIHSQRVTGPLKLVWQGVSQGLEGNETMLEPVIKAGRDLNLQIVRIDHIFNQYDLVSQNQGRLVFNFNKLDKLIRSILQMNAKPMLSLSYMPIILSSDGSITGSPQNWEEWEQIVEAVINRYSVIIYN